MTLERNRKCPKVSTRSKHDTQPHSREGQQQKKKESQTRAPQNICEETQSQMENAACWKLGWGLQAFYTNLGSVSSKTCPDL